MLNPSIIPLIAAIVPTVISQSYTFPLSPGQPYPQYNNAFDQRFSYNPSQQMYPSMSGVPSGQMSIPSQQSFNQNPVFSGMGQMRMHNPLAQRFQFNPMTRIQVQPPMQEEPGNHRVTSPLGPSEYQVDQKAPSEGPTRIVPPFLKSASVGEQDRFYEIVQHPTWSGAEKNRRIEEFMKTMSDERQTMYSDFRRDVVDREMEEKRRNVDRAVSQMSKAAVDEFQRVVRIMHDPNQMEQEKLKKIEEIYAKLPDAIRKEFDEKLKGF